MRTPTKIRKKAVKKSLISLITFTVRYFSWAS